MAKKITVSVISELTTDQRVIRICSSLQNMGFDVMVIARRFGDSLPLDNYNFKSHRIRCYFKKGVLQYAEFNFKLLLKLLFIKTDYFLANDLDVLVPNYFLSKLRNKKIFYDTHEYFTGVPELRQSPIKKKFWKFFEDRIFPKLPVVYTVNNSVKNQYQQEYGNTISVIRNVPMVKPIIDHLSAPSHWQNKTVLLLQGAGINNGRGGLELLKAMQYLPDYFHLVFIGTGTEWNVIALNRDKLHLQNKVDMISKVSPLLLQQYTAMVQIGFSLDSFDDLNYLYNLPNKVFDYIQASVPIIATGIPEVKQILLQYNCGISIDNNEPETIASAILEMTSLPNQYEQFVRNCKIAAKELSWEKESILLEKIYQSYL